MTVYQLKQSNCEEINVKYTNNKEEGFGNLNLLAGHFLYTWFRNSDFSIIDHMFLGGLERELELPHVPEPVARKLIKYCFWSLEIFLDVYENPQLTHDDYS